MCKLTINAIAFQPTFFALFFEVVQCFLHKTPGFSAQKIFPNYTSSANAINTVFCVKVMKGGWEGGKEGRRTGKEGGKPKKKKYISFTFIFYGQECIG